MGTNRALKHVAEIKNSFQSMTKHSITGIQALNNFLFESAGLRAWKAYNVGIGRFFSLAQLQKYGTPQGPTGIKELQPFSQPLQDVGTFRAGARQTQVVGPSWKCKNSIRRSRISSCPEQGVSKSTRNLKV